MISHLIQNIIRCYFKKFLKKRRYCRNREEESLNQYKNIRVVKRARRKFTKGIELPLRNPFLNFLRDFRNECRKCRHLNMTESAKLGAQIWRSLPEHRKRKFYVLSSIAPRWSPKLKRLASEVSLDHNIC